MALDHLGRLECDRLLKIYPKRGVLVPDISVNDVRDLYSIRAVLEPFAGRLATKRVAMGDVEKYAELLVQDFSSAREFLSVDQEAHSLFVQGSNSEHLISLLMEFYDHPRRLRSLISERIYSAKHLIDAEHLEIIQTLRDRDEDRVESAMRRHLENAAKRMSRCFDGEVGSTA